MHRGGGVGAKLVDELQSSMGGREIAEQIALAPGTRFGDGRGCRKVREKGGQGGKRGRGRVKKGRGEDV